MPIPAAIPIIAELAGPLLGALFGGGNKSKASRTTTPTYVDWFGNPIGGPSQDVHLKGPGGKVLQAYRNAGYTQDASDPTLYHHPGGAGGDIMAGLRGNLLDLLNNEIGRFNGGPNGGGFTIPHVGAEGYSAQHYTAAHAVASLIDMMDKAYNEKPDAGLREDVYSRLKSGATASADDSIRQLLDSARNSGAGPNAPWVQQLEMEARTKANQASTQGLTDFFDQYVTAALARRHEALAQNSRVATEVSEFNAGADNQASAFNASADNQAAAFGAAAHNAAGLENAQLAMQGEGIRQGEFGNLANILMQLTHPIQSGTTQVDTATGGTNWGAALSSLGHDILTGIANKGNSGGGIGAGATTIGSGGGPVSDGRALMPNNYNPLGWLNDANVATNFHTPLLAPDNYSYAFQI